MDNAQFENCFRLIRTYERLNATLPPLGAASRLIDRVQEIGDEDIGPEIREAATRLEELADHLEAASRVLNARLGLLLAEIIKE